jgi:hypothetical protein
LFTVNLQHRLTFGALQLWTRLNVAHGVPHAVTAPGTFDCEDRIANRIRHVKSFRRRACSAINSSDAAAVDAARTPLGGIYVAHSESQNQTGHRPGERPEHAEAYRTP